MLALRSIGDVAVLVSLSFFGLVLGLAHAGWNRFGWMRASQTALHTASIAVLLGVHGMIVVLSFGFGLQHEPLLLFRANNTPQQNTLMQIPLGFCVMFVVFAMFKQSSRKWIVEVLQYVMCVVAITTSLMYGYGGLAIVAVIFFNEFPSLLFAVWLVLREASKTQTDPRIFRALRIAQLAHVLWFGFVRFLLCPGVGINIAWNLLTSESSDKIRQTVPEGVIILWAGFCVLLPLASWPMAFQILRSTFQGPMGRAMVRQMLGVIGFLVLNVVWNMYHGWMFSNVSEGGGGFSLPLFVCGTSMIATTLVLRVFAAAGFYRPVAVPRRVFQIVFIMSIAYVFNVVLIDTTLLGPPVPLHTQQLVRTFIPLAVAGMIWNFDRASMSLWYMATVGMFVGGCVMCVLKSDPHTSFDILIAFVSVFNTSLYFVLLGVIVSPVFKLGGLDVLRLTAGPIALLATVVFVLSREYSTLASIVRERGWVDVLGKTVIAAVLSFGYTLVLVVLVKVTSALYVSVCISIKTALLVLFSISLFHIHITAVNAIGVCLSFISFAVVTFFHYDSNSLLTMIPEQQQQQQDFAADDYDGQQQPQQTHRNENNHSNNSYHEDNNMGIDDDADDDGDHAGNLEIRPLLGGIEEGGKRNEKNRGDMANVAM